MESGEYDRLRRLSGALIGNNVLIPVAAAVSIGGEGTVTVPAITQELGGRLPPNRIGKALAQLARLGALEELPYPGRPHARIYVYVDGPFWTFVRDWAMDPQVDVSVDNAQR